MGCKSSLCTDASELILSQPLNGKLSDITASASEKSTNPMASSFSKKQRQNRASIIKLLKLKSLLNIGLKELPNTPVLNKLFDIWIQEIVKIIEKNQLSPEDLKLSISLDSNGNSIMIKADFDEIRSFGLVDSFAEKASQLLNLDFDYEYLNEKSKFLLSVCPLTLIFYLKLGVDIDFGIGIEKPVERKQLVQFLSESKDANNIFSWISRGVQPIALSLFCSMFSRDLTVNFYLFDGLKIQNFNKGIELFEEFGAPVDKDWRDLFRSLNTTDEVSCGLELDKNQVKRIYVQIKTPHSGEDLLNMIDCSLNISKWNAFRKMAPGSSLALELNVNGFVLKTISSL